MTVYNGRPYFGTAIRSILAQTFTDFEFIIVDDGSNDGSKDVVAEYSDSRIRFFTRPHRGRSDTLNFALDKCRGEYIAIADADDTSSPERLSLQVAFFEKHPECDVVGSWIQMTDEEGKTLRLIRYYSDHEQIVDTMPYSCSVSLPSVMIRRRFLDHHIVFDPGFLVAHDLELWLRILPFARFANIPLPLLQYRVRDDSLAHKMCQRATSETRALALDYYNRSQHINEEDRLFGMARVEYYYGTLKTARSLLAELLRQTPLRFAYWRFMLPALLGQRFLHFIRRTRISRLPGALSRIISKDGSLSPP